MNIRKTTIMKTDTNNDTTNLKYTATASHNFEGRNMAGLTLILDGGQARTFPMFSVRFIRGGSSLQLGYIAIVLDAPAKAALPAEGPLVFDTQRRADQSMICMMMTDPDGNRRVMETAFVTDAKGGKFMIAMAEQLGDLPCRTKGYPFFLTYRDDPLPEAEHGCQGGMAD